MVFDLSEKGRKEFYEYWFKKSEEILNDTRIDYEGKCKLLSISISSLKNYSSQIEMYHQQVGIFWEIKKNYAVIENLELKENGKISLKTEESKEFIKKYEERLKKMSSSFESDLEKVIKNDKDVKTFTFSNLN